MRNKSIFIASRGSFTLVNYEQNNEVRRRVSDNYGDFVL